MRLSVSTISTTGLLIASLQNTCPAVQFTALRIVLHNHKRLEDASSNKRDALGCKPLSKLARSLLQLEKSEKLRPCYFYVLPKMHKTKLARRPIVDNVNSPTYFASQYLHKELVHITRYPYNLCGFDSPRIAKDGTNHTATQQCYSLC